MAQTLEKMELKSSTRTVKLTIHRAVDLRVGDVSTLSSDPYVKIRPTFRVPNYKGDKIKTLGKTKTIKKVRTEAAEAHKKKTNGFFFWDRSRCRPEILFGKRTLLLNWMLLPSCLSMVFSVGNTLLLLYHVTFLPMLH